MTLALRLRPGVLGSPEQPGGSCCYTPTKVGGTWPHTALERTLSATHHVLQVALPLETMTSCHDRCPGVPRGTSVGVGVYPLPGDLELTLGR